MRNLLLFLDNISKLIALGFKPEDCITALEKCEGKLDDAALWLTQNAVPIHSYAASHQHSNEGGSPFIKAIEVQYISNKLLQLIGYA